MTTLNKKSIQKPKQYISRNNIVKESNKIDLIKEKNHWFSISKWTMFSLIFLLPIFSLFSLAPFYFAKQTLLLALVSASVLFWIIGAFSDGKVSLPRFNLLTLISLGVVLIGGIVSLIFSSSFNFGLFGTTGGEIDSILNIFAGVISFLLVSTLFKTKKDFKLAVGFFIASICFVFLFTALNILFNAYLNKPFLGISTIFFNLVGTIYTFSILLGASFMMFLGIFFSFGNGIKKTKKIFWGIAIALAFLAIIAIGYRTTFLILALSLVVFLVLWFSKFKESNPLKLNIVLCFFFICLIFSFLFPLFNGFFNLPPNVGLNLNSSWKISVDTLKEGFKNFLIGSGSNTYTFDFLKQKPVGINFTEFWNTDFSNAYSFWLTILPSLGIATVLALLIFFATLFITNSKSFIKSKIVKEELSGFELGMFSFFSFLFIGSFMNPLNSVLLILLFISAGVIVAMISSISNNRRVFTFFEPPQKMFICSLLLMCVLTGSVLSLFFVGKRFVAVVNTNIAVASFYETKDIDSTIPKLVDSFNLFSTGDSARILSQLWFSKLNQFISNSGSSKDEVEALKPKIQEALDAGTLSIKNAISLNPENYYNWLMFGGYYENLLNYASGADNVALSAYQKAVELNPKNPVLFLSMARINFWQANNKPENKLDALMSAENNLNKALELKQDYIDAVYLLGIVYEQKGDKELAIKQMEVVLEIEPNNQDIIKKLEELKK